MKRSLSLKWMLVVLIALFMVTGCDDDTVDDIIDLGTLSVTLGDEVYDFALVEAVEAEDMIVIAGADAVSDTAIFTLMVASDIEPGTNHLEAGPDGKVVLKSEEFDSEFFAIWYKGMEDAYYSESGSLTVEKHDKGAKEIKGSFLLVMKKGDGTTLDANDGKFNVKYQSYDEIPE